RGMGVANWRLLLLRAREIVRRRWPGQARTDGGIMIDHLGIPVSDYARSKAFYLQALAPLGYGVVLEFGSGDHASVGLGAGGKPDLWLSPGKRLSQRLHIAFTAETRAIVDDFYRAAIKAGGVDNGEPGIREHYHPNYYGAFVLDPDGHNIEAVC